MPVSETGWRMASTAVHSMRCFCMLQVSVQRRETERQAEARLKSYSHHAKQETEEPWVKLRLHSAGRLPRLLSVCLPLDRHANPVVCVHANMMDGLLEAWQLSFALGRQRCDGDGVEQAHQAARGEDRHVAVTRRVPGLYCARCDTQHAARAASQWLCRVLMNQLAWVCPVLV